MIIHLRNLRVVLRYSLAILRWELRAVQAAGKGASSRYGGKQEIEGSEINSCRRGQCKQAALREGGTALEESSFRALRYANRNSKQWVTEVSACKLHY